MPRIQIPERRACALGAPVLASRYFWRARAMYKEFYGLREYPFNMTPDPQFLFLSHNHRIALDVLRFGIRERKGFIAITGEVGAGKTTLCRALLNSLDNATTKTALILNPTLSDS